MAPTRIVSILGPTGVGKSAAALDLPMDLPERPGIINFDSRQVYADAPLITAQPSAEERARAPHWLYGFLEPDQGLDAAGFATLAAKAIGECAAQGRLPVLVGGTGFYLKVLLEGIAPIPSIPDEVRQAVLERVEQEGPQALHAELERIDPDYARVIHPNDTQRNARAMEVWLGTGQTMTHWHSQAHPAGEFQALKLAFTVDLDELEPRLAERIEAMLAAGALDEARTLLDKCPDQEAPVWSAIGCAELRAHLEGELSLDQAKHLWLKNTRAYAKRQLTWCRREKDIVWVEASDPAALGRAVADWLAG